MSAAFSLPSGLPSPRRDCVFTTVLLAGGRPVHWDRHRARLQRSCQELYGRTLPDALDGEVAGQAAASAGVRRLSVRVTAGAASELAVRLEVADVAAGPRLAVHLATVGGRTGDWQHKWCDRSQLDAAQQAVGPDRVPLFLDHDGRVLETSRANVVVADGSTLRLPPPSAGALPGVTVQVLQERARLDGMTVLQAPLTVADLRGPLVATCSSISGLVAVRAVDERALQPDEPLLARLRGLLTETPAR